MTVGLMKYSHPIMTVKLLDYIPCPCQPHHDEADTLLADNGCNQSTTCFPSVHVHSLSADSHPRAKLPLSGISRRRLLGLINVLQITLLQWTTDALPCANHDFGNEILDDGPSPALQPT